jgi:hypothetical protein
MLVLFRKGDDVVLVFPSLVLPLAEQRRLITQSSNELFCCRLLCTCRTTVIDGFYSDVPANNDTARTIRRCHKP